MPDTVESPTEERFRPRERVEHALAEVTALLRKHRLVEGLLQDQLEHAPESVAARVPVESAVARHNREEGRDPALGSSVMITAVTDPGGFFIFLGLAKIFLV